MLETIQTGSEPRLGLRRPSPQTFSSKEQGAAWVQLERTTMVDTQCQTFLPLYCIPFSSRTTKGQCPLKHDCRLLKVYQTTATCLRRENGTGLEKGSLKVVIGGQRHKANRHTPGNPFPYHPSLAPHQHRTRSLFLRSIDAGLPVITRNWQYIRSARWPTPMTQPPCPMYQKWHPSLKQASA